MRSRRRQMAEKNLRIRVGELASPAGFRHVPDRVEGGSDNRSCPVGRDPLGMRYTDVGVGDLRQTHVISGCSGSKRENCIRSARLVAASTSLGAPDFESSQFSTPHSRGIHLECEIAVANEQGIYFWLPGSQKGNSSLNRGTLKQTSAPTCAEIGVRKSNPSGIVRSGHTWQWNRRLEGNTPECEEHGLSRFSSSW